MKFIILFLLPLLLISKELKIASYNVDNFFDMVKDGTEYNDYIPNMHNWTKPIFQKKITNITKVICDLNADVLALEEIENKNALNILLKNLNRVGCLYRYSAITNNRGAINSALISKIPINKYKTLKVSSNPRDRDILEVDLDLEPKLKIFVNHWRSKAAPESFRVRYAKALIKRISKLPKDSEYIILGDFNSEYNECSIISQKNNDTNGICGIDTILKTFYNGRLLKLRDNLDLNSSYHYNLWSELSPHKRWSHDFYGKKAALDSIIIPKTLIDNKGWFYKKDSFYVFKKSYLFKKGKRNRLNVWEYKHSKHLGKGYSDHLPIYAYFSNSTKKELKHETILDKFWKLFIPKVKKSNKKYLKEVTLNTLAEWKFLKSSVILKDGCVVFKRGDSGVLKSSKNSSAITLYKSADGLKEGHCYILKIYKKKRYYGLDEILDLDIVEDIGNINVEDYIKEFDINSLESYKVGDIVKNIKGIYRDKYLNIDGKRVKIYAKRKRKGIFTKGSNLYIKKAQIGYYKGEKELVIYSVDDVIKEN